MNERVNRLKNRQWDVFTAEDVASILGLAQSTVEHYLRSGRLQGYQIGRKWFMQEDDLISSLNRIKREGKL